MTASEERPTLSDELFGLEQEEQPVRPERPDTGLGLSWPDYLGPVPSWGVRISAGLGFAVYAIINVFVMWVPLHDDRVSAVPQAVVLLAVAFGLGSLLAWHVRGFWRPFGFGMMAGWLALTAFTVGYATGLS
ncbi:hypothetical protein GCM10027589_13760 [Actinocorallia lasiicapitis]